MLDFGYLQFKFVLGKLGVQLDPLWNALERVIAERGTAALKSNNAALFAKDNAPVIGNNALLAVSAAFFIVLAVKKLLPHMRPPLLNMRLLYHTLCGISTGIFFPLF